MGIDWFEVLAAGIFGALIGYGLGGIISFLVYSILGKRLSPEVNNAIIWIGIILGYAFIKTYMK